MAWVSTVDGKVCRRRRLIDTLNGFAKMLAARETAVRFDSERDGCWEPNALRR
jgi:hypothetical protein